MKRCIRYILITVFAFCSYNAHSQIDSIRKTTPVLKSVSIQPETDYAELKWSVEPSPYIAGFKILYYDKNFGGFFRFKTLWDPLLDSYIDSSYTSKSFRTFSVSYAVEAIDKSENPSKLSNSINTIFTSVSIDTCNNKITITWNSYDSFPIKVKGYSVLASVNGGNYTEASNMSADIRSFVLNDFITNSVYCFVVRANLEGGISSTSNKACLSTKMQRPPEWINADYATVSTQNRIDLSFTIDPYSEIFHFSLGRKKEFSGGEFKEIAQLSSVNGSVRYTDPNARIDSVYLYKLIAINNCNNSVASSNAASNLVLSLERKGNDLNLGWNSYKDWLGTLAGYHLFINTGKGFEERFISQTSDTTLTLGYNEIMYEVSADNVCFYISASETSNPHGVSGRSQSSQVCTEPTEVITVPNVFTPNNDLVNDLFRPVLSFTPKTYHLVISDRLGNIILETTDYQAEWDGSEGRNRQAQGVYLWYLKVTTPSGKVISKTGTVTILNHQ